MPSNDGRGRRKVLGKIRVAFIFHPLVLTCECICFAVVAAVSASGNGACGSDRGAAGCTAISAIRTKLLQCSKVD